MNHGEAQREASPSGMKFLEAADEHHALEELHRMGCTDGLPVVIPTSERVERMILAGGLPGDLSLGSIGPLEGAATVEAVAVCTVMAGCLPDYFPIVLAAVRGLCDPVFDIAEVQMTTHDAGPMIIVNGPARLDFGPFESGTGALGPGNRANATVGRAVRLCLLNIGGGHPGVGDMALFGHPGKFTLCLAEAEEDSPFPPLHTRLGYSDEQSTVTLVNVDGPQSVACAIEEDIPASAERLLHQLASAAGNPATNNGASGFGEVVVMLNPEHARALFAAGLTVRDVAQRVTELAKKPRRLIHAGPVDPAQDPEELVGISADQLLIMVAGGGGVYSKVAPSWGWGTHRSQHVVTEVLYGEACEIPGAAPPTGQPDSWPKLRLGQAGETRFRRGRERAWPSATDDICGRACQKCGRSAASAWIAAPRSPAQVEQAAGLGGEGPVLPRAPAGILTGGRRPRPGPPAGQPVRPELPASRSRAGSWRCRPRRPSGARSCRP